MSISNPNEISPTGGSIAPAGPEVTPSTVPLLTDTPPISDSIVSSDLATPSITSPQTTQIPLTAPTLSLSQFFESVTSALDQLRQTLYSAESQDYNTLLKMYFNAIVEAQALTKLFGEVQAISKQEQQLYSQEKTQVNNINSAIKTYNTNISTTAIPPTEDEIQTQTMNTAITTFNNSQQTPQDVATFTAAANAYNTYVASRDPVIDPFVSTLNQSISDYNNQVAKNNTLIENINSTLVELGQPPLPLQSTLPNATDLPLVSLPPVAPVSLLPSRDPLTTLPAPTPPKSTSQLLAQIYNPKYNSQIPPAVTLLAYMQIVNAHRDYLHFFLQSRVITQPNNYVEPIPSLFFSSNDGVDTLSGPTLGSIAVNLDNRYLSKVLSNGIFKQATAQFSRTETPQLWAAVQSLTLKTISIAALAAPLPATRLVLEHLPVLDFKAAHPDILLGLTFSSHLLNLITSDDHQAALQGLVRSSIPGLDENQLKQLSSSVTAGVNLSLAQFALTQVAQSLGIPGLSAQIVSNVAGEPVQDAIRNLSGPLTIKDTLQNFPSTAFLKSALANQLNSLGTPTEVANNQVNVAVNRALASQEIQSSQELQSAVSEELKNVGVTHANAAALGQTSASFINAENLGANLLDTELQKQQLNGQNLSNGLLAAGISQENATQAVTKALDAGAQSTRGLRDAISNELVALGESLDKSLTASTKAVTGPGLTPLNTSPATPAEVAKQAIALLSPTLGVTEAQKIANQLNLVLFGTPEGGVNNPHSLVNQISQQVEKLVSLKNTKINQQLTEFFREFNKPNYDLYTFNKRIMDPANTLTFSIWTGDMYKGQGDFPSNYQKTLDVLI